MSCPSTPGNAPTPKRSGTSCGTTPPPRLPATVTWTVGPGPWRPYLQSELGAVVGERCVLMLPSGADFAAAFFGCFYAGMIAVPAFPPDSHRQAYLERLAGIIRDARPRAVLGLTADLDRCQSQLQPGLADDCRLIRVDQVPDDCADALRPHRIDDDDLAFLQYTSGSTSAPKGVMVSHANLMANERAMAGALAPATTMSGSAGCPCSTTWA